MSVWLPERCNNLHELVSEEDSSRLLSECLAERLCLRSHLTLEVELEVAIRTPSAAAEEAWVVVWGADRQVEATPSPDSKISTEDEQVKRTKTSGIKTLKRKVTTTKKNFTVQMMKRMII